LLIALLFCILRYIQKGETYGKETPT